MDLESSASVDFKDPAQAVQIVKQREVHAKQTELVESPEGTSTPQHLQQSVLAQAVGVFSEDRIQLTETRLQLGEHGGILSWDRASCDREAARGHEAIRED